MIHISLNSNKKLGCIPSISLPPVTTCRADAPCFRECYARRGNYRFANVQKSLTDNLQEYYHNKQFYFDFIKAQIWGAVQKYGFFRWHGAGDIVDAEYLRGMVKLAQELPQVHFLTFTKKYQLINEHIDNGGAMPENLHIVFSVWDCFPMDNPHNLPTAHIKLNDNTPIPPQAMECGGDCVHCLKCWELRNGEAVFFKKH